MCAERVVKYKMSRDQLKFLRRFDKMKRAWDHQLYIDSLKKEGHAKGHAEGHAKGHAEGRADEKLAIARKMKEAGISNEQINTLTGLSFETIAQMK